MRIKLIYLLGAGRSGTTLIATVLNNNNDITTIGEMHQFEEHLTNNKACSCGKNFEYCQFWKNIVKDLTAENLQGLKYCEKKELHKQIPKLLFTKKVDEQYLKNQEEIFEKIADHCSGRILLDSSKYIARYLLLSKSKKIHIKGIYVVRDIRGVINSFLKKVQTTKGSFATILYYSLINLFGELVFRFDKKIIKVRYEDFVENPVSQLTRINNHIFGQQNKEVVLPSNMVMPHIVGGNRMKKNKNIEIRPDYKWKTNLTNWQKVCYYLATLPFMIINKYKV